MLHICGISVSGLQPVLLLIQVQVLSEIAKASPVHTLIQKAQLFRRHAEAQARRKSFQDWGLGRGRGGRAESEPKLALIQPPFFGPYLGSLPLSSPPPPPRSVAAGLQRVCKNLLLMSNQTSQLGGLIHCQSKSTSGCFILGSHNRFGGWVTGNPPS